MDEALLVSVPVAARRLSLGRTTVYELCAAGLLPKVSVGRAARIPTAALEEFVAKRTAAARRQLPSPRPLPRRHGRPPHSSALGS